MSLKRSFSEMSQETPCNKIPQLDNYKYIECKNKAGEIVAYSQVDIQFYDDLIKFKWYLKDGYPCTHYNNSTKGMHQIIADLGNLEKKYVRHVIDHKDNERLNNTIKNLHYVSYSFNNHNRKKRPGCSSKFKGVHLNKRRMTWGVFFQGKTAYFSNEISAAYCYDEFARAEYGDEANVNDVEKPLTYEQDRLKGLSRKSSEDKFIIYRPERSKPYEVAIRRCGKVHYNSFHTKEEAKTYRDIIMQQIKNDLESKRPDIVLTRNLDGIACFIVKDKEILVDDDIWFKLCMHKFNIMKGRATNHSNYAGLHINKKSTLLHMFVLNRFEASDGKVIDHINRNGLDNRRENLQIVDKSVNAQNIAPRSSNSNYKGLECMRGDEQLQE
jgi:hypothetical protein